MRSWGPPPVRRWLYLAGAVVAAALALVAERDADDLGPGPALGVLAAIALVLGGMDSWFARVLSVDAEGVVVHRGPWRRRYLDWAEIERIDAVEDTRGLLRLASLEIDLGDSLIVLSRHRLGADPAVVAEDLRSARSNGSPR